MLVVNHKGLAYSFSTIGTEVILNSVATLNAPDVNINHKMIEVPLVVLEKIKNKIKNNINFSGNISAPDKRLEVICFSSFSASIIWSSFLENDTVKAFVEDFEGNRWSEAPDCFSSGGAIDCYCSHEPLSLITIETTSPVGKITLDLLDWVLIIDSPFVN